MGLYDLIDKFKNGWDRVVGSFLHGEETYEQEYGLYNEPYNYPPETYESKDGYYNQGYQDYQSYDERAHDLQNYQDEGPYVSPYTGSYERQMGWTDENSHYNGAEQQNIEYAHQKQANRENNMVAFPGVELENAMNVSPVNVKAQIIQLKNRETCKIVIEALKDYTTVIVNMENVASDNEKQRCVDMLGGAAYTLSCQISKVSGKGVYIISPNNVIIEMDEGSLRLNGIARQARDTYAGPRYSGGRSPLYQQEDRPLEDRYNEQAREQQRNYFTPPSYEREESRYYRQQAPNSYATYSDEYIINRQAR